MEHRISYTVIGAFVLVLGGILAASLIWLASGGVGGKYNTYAMYLKSGAESLSRDSAVLYHGVGVGRVTSVGLDPEHPERARILLDVRANVPLKTDTEATVETRGLTGSGYVELSGGAHEAPLLTAKPGEKYPAIPTRPGTLESLAGTVRHVAQKITELSDRLDQVLSEKNVKAVSDSLANIRDITSNLAARAGTLDSVIANMDATFANARAASSKLPALVADLRTTLASYRIVAQKIGDAASGVDAASNSLGSLTPQAQGLLSQLAQVSQSLNALVEQLSRQPNSVIVGRKLHPGPGESGKSGG
ncbi:MAG: MlaD family protein [Gammaproteobacteria bacterium]